MANIDSVLKTVNKLYPSAIKSESVSKYITQITELKEQVSKLGRELSEVNRLYERLQQSYQQKAEKADSLSAETLSLGRDVRSNSFSLSPTYRIEPPILIEDELFLINVPFGCKYYDIMLVSDFHIKEFDRKVLNGFDPIGLLASERDDFLNLGYTHAMISMNNLNTSLGVFDIHHPDTFNFPIILDENGIDIGEISEYLSNIYDRQGRNREESYIDLFGHTHRNQFNYASSYCYIPPFFEGKNRRGACHLRIYFDEDTGIKYMVFMPLSISTKLTKNNEIVYQKVMSR